MVIETVLRSEELPAAERFDWWRDTIDRSLPPAIVTTDHTDGFRATARQLRLGTVRVSVLAHPPMWVDRCAALVRRSDPGLYHLALPLRGTRRIALGKHDAVLAAGDLLLHDTRGCTR
ncbi:hypothetical protein ACEZCY_24690 [Streptacidiphilus sp. N1-12]|uniref:Transcription regulator HTH AraC- type ligand binding domain-containing protein n=2 Tax=Streptacidiphilus alkalitolerans TaxID=3342712 RepID=A0ABV6V887_9ACTN